MKEFLKNQILDISRRLNLSHIGSNISILPILMEIYSIKQFKDLVILDCAHAHLAHLLFTNYDNYEELINKYGTHCDRRVGCDVSGGSLGHAGGVAIGMALAQRDRNVYVIFSDGSIQEGSNWESLRIMQELKLSNIKCYFNINGYTALEKINKNELANRILQYYPKAQIRFTQNSQGYEGVGGHYKKAI